MPKKIDLTGQRFGRLVVIRESGRTKGGQAMWLCRCDCGAETVIRGSSLRSGHTQSCGCLRDEKLATIPYVYEARLSE